MKRATVLMTALVVGTWGFALVGCQKTEGPAERAGKEVDKAGQHIENAGDKVQDAVQGKDHK